jgi:hypothetical protein
MMEPRVIDDALSSSWLPWRCSSSWGLVAPRHRWPRATAGPQAPWEQMDIRYVKGGGGSGDGTPVATRGCMGGARWTGGQSTRGRAVDGVVIGTGALGGAGVGSGEGGSAVRVRGDGGAMVASSGCPVKGPVLCGVGGSGVAGVALTCR